MTPERRKEVRLADDASFRARVFHENERLKERIKELESNVITDNTKTLTNALERIKVLESLLAVCASELIWSNSFYTNPDKKQLIDDIDAILPVTEFDK